MSAHSIVDSVVKWVRGIVVDPNPTAAEYAASNAPWQKTFVELAIPVAVVSYLAGFLLALLTGGSMMGGVIAAAPLWFVVSVVWGIAFLLVAALVFDYFGTMFGGTRSFDQAVALITLAMIPSLLGNVVAPLPWIGWLLSLAATIYSLVLLYRFVPMFLIVPEPNRVKHFVVALVTCLVINIVAATMIGAVLGAGMVASGGFGDADSASSTFGTGFERQAALMEAAQADTYDPPADGEMTASQVDAYVVNMTKTNALRDRLAKKYDGKEEPAGLSDLLGGMNDMMRVTSAEMEVVKGAGGNWAEHLWVKQSLETARVQQEGSAAIAHNYALYLDHQEEIDALD